MVVTHGMGDSCFNPGMKSITKVLVIGQTFDQKDFSSKKEKGWPYLSLDGRAQHRHRQSIQSGISGTTALRLS